MPDTVLLGKVTHLGKRTRQVPKREDAEIPMGSKGSWPNKEAGASLGQKENRELERKQGQMNDSKKG